MLVKRQSTRQSESKAPTPSTGTTKAAEAKSTSSTSKGDAAAHELAPLGWPAAGGTSPLADDPEDRRSEENRQTPLLGTKLTRMEVIRQKASAAADRFLEATRSQSTKDSQQGPELGYVRLDRDTPEVSMSPLALDIRAPSCPIDPGMAPQYPLGQDIRAPSAPIDPGMTTEDAPPYDIALDFPSVPGYAPSGSIYPLPLSSSNQTLYPNLQEGVHSKPEAPYVRLDEVAEHKAAQAEAPPVTIHLPSAMRATTQELAQSRESRRLCPVLNNFKVDASGIRLDRFTTISPHDAAALIRDVLKSESLDSAGKLDLLMATNKAVPLLQAAVTHKVTDDATFEDICSCVEQIASSDLPIEAKETLMRSINAKEIMTKSGQGVASIAKMIGVLMSLPKGPMADRLRLLATLGLDKEELIARVTHSSRDGRQERAVKNLKDAMYLHRFLDGSGSEIPAPTGNVRPVRMVFDTPVKWEGYPVNAVGEVEPYKVVLEPPRVHMLCVDDDITRDKLIHGVRDQERVLRKFGSPWGEESKVLGSRYRSLGAGAVQQSRREPQQPDMPSDLAWGRRDGHGAEKSYTNPAFTEFVAARDREAKSALLPGFVPPRIPPSHLWNSSQRHFERNPEYAKWVAARELEELTEGNLPADSAPAP